MQKDVRALLVGAAVWIGSFLVIWTLLKLATPHMETRFSDTIFGSIVLLVATLNALMTVVTKGVNWVAQRFCNGKQSTVLWSPLSLVFVWIVAAGITGVILVWFSALMTLPISLRTLIILSCTYATAATLLSHILAHILHGSGNDDDCQEVIVKTEPITAAMEQRINQIEITGGKIIPFPAIKDRRS